MTLELKFVPVLYRVSCCTYSCTLKTATLAVGIIMTVTDIVFIISDSVELATIKEHEEQQTVFESPEFTIVMIVMSVVEAITCCLLLYGAWKERPRWLLPYLILLLSTIVLISLLLLITSIIALVYNILGGLIALIIGALIIGIHMYIWIICYSYYRQLEEEQCEPSDCINFQNEHPTVDLHANAA